MNEARIEKAFEYVLTDALLAAGYLAVPPESFDRERAVFPKTVLAVIRETQPSEWAKLEALHGANTKGCAANPEFEARG